MTTSESARQRIDAHLLDAKTKDGEKATESPMWIRVNFSDRSCINKLEYLLYRVIKCVYVAVWYYFIPLASVTISYALAAYFSNENGCIPPVPEDLF